MCGWCNAACLYNDSSLAGNETIGPTQDYLMGEYIYLMGEYIQLLAGNETIGPTQDYQG